MALVVTIAGNNRTSVVKHGSLAVEQQAANFITVCSLTLIDEAGDIDIVEEDAITLVDGATTFFTGRVVEIRYSLFTACSRFIKIKCQDPNYQLLETVIDQEEEFPGGAGHGGITADADIIDHLFDDYLPGVTTDDFALNQTIQDPLTITFAPCTLRSMLSQICTRTGGYFYIDFDDVLHYFEAETSGVAWWLTDDPARDAPATNLITNPSIEVDTTSWVAAGTTISRDIAYFRFGVASLRVITDNGAAGERVRIDVDAVTAINTEYTFSIYLRGAGTVQLWFSDAIGGPQPGPVITLATVWTRHEFTVTFGAGAGRTVGIITDVQQGITFYCDGFQLEAHDHASSYFDGSFGTDFAWTGAAHASTSTRGAGATSFFEASLDKTTLATTRLDGVFVIGADVSGWRGTHAAGDRQGIARDNRITTATGVQNRGDAVLARYGDPQVTYTVKIYEPGLRAGMVILFICELYGVNGIFTIRKMVIKWDGCGDAYYILTLGDVVNPSLITERNWIDGLVSAIGPITSPMLPTSSRGWSQNIVFSATDHDTVGWAGGNDITLADGTVYTINAGNTGNMAEIHYIYLDIDIATNALQVTHDAATSVGTHKVLVAVAEDVAAGKDAIFQAFGGSGQGVMVTADNIVALTITTNEIAANTIVAGNIAAGTITATEIAALTITAAEIAANTITADKIEMGLGDALFNNADGLLLFGPYCEISPTEWWSLRKQKATLSGAFHRVAGKHQGTRALVIEEGITNRIKNPSIETNTTSWVVVGSTLTRDSTYSMFGDYALKIVTDDAAANEGAYSIVTAETAINTEYTFSVYLRGSGTVRLRFWDAGGGHQGGNLITLTDVWTRHQITKTFGVGAVRHVYVYASPQQGITFYCDGFQLEASAYATTYCDGDQGIGYAWTGAAHASTSTRTVTEVNLDAHVGLISSNATFSFRIVAQMPYDADATWANAIAYLFDAWSAADRIIANFSTGDNTFRVYIDGADRLSSAAQTFKAGDWVDIVVTLDFAADDYNLYINGLLADNDTTALAAQVVTQWNIGSNVSDATRHGSFAFDEFAVFDRVLTAIEVAGLYALDRPMVDMGSLDSPGLYILDGKFKIASSTTGNRIEITADEIAGYDSAGTKQFYLQASDGVAVAGAGAVLLDVDGLRMVGSGITGDTRRLRFMYDDFGTERLMGRIYGNYGGGATPSLVWVHARRVAGDPWNGSQVVIAAEDQVAAEGVYIYADSAGIIDVQGTTKFMVDALLRPGKLAGDPAADLESGCIYYDTTNNRLRLRIGGGVWATIDHTSD